MFTIDIYNKNTKPTDFFNRNGDATLEKCISCVSKERLNGDYSLEVVYPLNDRKSKYFQKWNVIKADGQLFRIYNTINDYFENKITVYAKHIFYDLDNYFTEDKRAVDCDVLSAMKRALETDELNNIFTAYSDITAKNTLYFVEQSPMTSMFEIIKRWGVGELIRDNYNITIRNDVTYTEEYEIRYKKNMLGLVVDENVDNIVTRIYPVGYNGITLTEKYIDVPGIKIGEEGMPPQHITKKIKFDDVQDEVNLRIEAKLYAEKLSIPFTNIKCDLLEISDLDIYKRFKNVKKIGIGDVCKVIHENHNINTFMKCVYIEKDLIKSENNKVELGELKDVLDKKPDFSDVYTQIEASKPVMYFSQNSNKLLITNSSQEELFYEGINVVSSTHLKLYVAISCNNFVEDNEVQMRFYVNNNSITFQPNHKLKVGYNTIGIPLAIPALQGGEVYYVSVKIKTTLGEVEILPENAQIFAEGVGLSGGFGTGYPHAEVIEEIFVSYDTVLDNVKDVKSDGNIILDEMKRTNVGENVDNSYENIKDLMDYNCVYSSITSISLIKVVDEYFLNKENSSMFEFDEECIGFNENLCELKTTLENEAVVDNFEEGYIHTVRLPIKTKYEKIEREYVVYE